MSANLYNFRVPVYKGVPLTWMKSHPSFNNYSWSTIPVWKDSLSEKWELNYATLGFPFIRGSLPMNEMKPIPWRWQLVKCTPVKRFTFRKVSAKYTALGFTFIRGFPPHEWNDTHPLMMTARQVYACGKFSLSEKWVLIYATLGFPFIRGFPSHEWN